MNDQHAQRLAASGMPPIPPHYTCHRETFLAKGFEIGRKLSLDKPDDVRWLRNQADAVLPELATLIRNNLDDYMNLFTDAEWRIVYDGPSLLLPAGQQRLLLYELAQLLDLTEKYKAIAKYQGADQTLAGLRNPPQIPGTLFEIESAAWYASRPITKTIVFGPQLTHPNGGTSHPDFLWDTEFGPLYCECKQASHFDSEFSLRAHRVAAFVGQQMPTGVSHLRFEFLLGKRHGGEHAIRRLLAAALADLTAGRQWIDSNITLKLHQRGSERMTGGFPRMLISNVPATTSPTPLDYRGATYLVEVMAEHAMQTLGMNLVREARSQLTPNVVGIPIIGMPSPAAAKVLKAKLETVINDPAYERTPCIFIWAAGGVDVVWRLNQPFGAKFIEALMK
jgi:hypothetical protein